MFVVLCSVEEKTASLPVGSSVLVLAGAKVEVGVEYKVGVCPPLHQQSMLRRPCFISWCLPWFPLNSITC